MPPKSPRSCTTTPTSSSPLWSPVPTAPGARSPRGCDRSNTWWPPTTRSARPTSGAPAREATEQIEEIVAIAHDSDVTVEVIVATAWDCPFEGPTPPERVLEIAAAARDHGVDRFSIADTIGTTTPRRVSSLIAQLRPVIGDMPLGGHFHNTRGTGLASAYAAVSSGVTRLDASVGGLGGCPFAPGATGNIATEDLVYLLRDSDIDVDVDLQAAIAAAEVAKSVVGHDLPSALLRAGDRIRA